MEERIDEMCVGIGEADQRFKIFTDEKLNPEDSGVLFKATIKDGNVLVDGIIGASVIIEHWRGLIHKSTDVSVKGSIVNYQPSQILWALEEGFILVKFRIVRDGDQVYFTTPMMFAVCRRLEMPCLCPQFYSENCPYMGRTADRCKKTNDQLDTVED